MNEARGILARTRWRHTTRHWWLVDTRVAGIPEKFYVIATTLGKTSTCARRCWSSRFWHSDWKSGLFPDFYRKYSKVRTFPGPGRPCFKISTFPGNKDRVGTMNKVGCWGGVWPYLFIKFITFCIPFTLFLKSLKFLKMSFNITFSTNLNINTYHSRARDVAFHQIFISELTCTFNLQPTMKHYISNNMIWKSSS